MVDIFLDLLFKIFLYGAVLLLLLLLSLWLWLLLYTVSR